MKLYKYRSVDKHTRAMLVDRDFYANVPAALDDVFDCRPHYDMTHDPDVLFAHVVDAITEVHPARSPDLIRREAQVWVSNNWPLSVEKVEKFRREYVDEVNDAGIVCFSDAWDILPMWALYGNKHRGICVELETDAFDQPGPQCVKVEYVEDRPSINLFRQRREANRLAVGIKGRDWAFQQEWRLALKREAHSPLLPTCVRLAAGVVTSVILGARISSRNRKQVLAWARKAKPRLAVYDALPDERHYKMNRRLVDPGDQVLPPDVGGSSPTPRREF